MTRGFSLRQALSQPAVVRDVVDELLRRMRSPDPGVQLRATRALLLLTLRHVQQNFTPKPGFESRRCR